MRPVFRSSLIRFIARLMCWALLFGWMAGAANACVLKERQQEMAQHAQPHAHSVSEASHRHHHDAGNLADSHDGAGHDAGPGQQACKSLCDGEQHAVSKPGDGDLPWQDCVASTTAASCLILPALVPARVPRPDAVVLPAPPPIPIAFLRLTI